MEMNHVGVFKKTVPGKENMPGSEVRTGKAWTGTGRRWGRPCDRPDYAGIFVHQGKFWTSTDEEEKHNIIFKKGEGEGKKEVI
jgi:hypothetical protein